jgi:fumarate reductase flavoprotein subunit
MSWDFIVAGAGTAGLTTAIFAAQRGARVLLLEAAERVGGTLHWSSAQMSGAGTRRQAERGIQDHPDLHFDDVMRITAGRANPELVRLAVDHAADTLNWLEDEGFDFEPTTPVIFHGHQAYGRARTYWGREEGRSILAVLERRLNAAIATGQVELLLKTQFRELLTMDGAVTGVRLQHGDGALAEEQARHVLIATGGYASNPDLFEEFHHIPQYAQGFCPTARGGGIMAAQAVGARIVNADCDKPIHTAVLRDTAFPSPYSVRLATVPQIRAPWEIWVNERGERFVAEDAEWVDDRESALQQQPHQRMWVVFDQAIRDAAPSLVWLWFDEAPKDPFASHANFFQADSLAKLAAAAGVDEAGLQQSVESYNAGQVNGNDAFGRAHMPRPIAEAPFYAIRMQGCGITTAAGLAVDSALRVLNETGQPIPNLYAIGEALGSGQTMGASASGGMMVTPALTFGRLLGQRLSLD